MTDKTIPVIVRNMRLPEMVKVSRMLIKQGWKPSYVGIQMLVLTIPNPTGGKRLIVGTVGIKNGNRICFLLVSHEHRRKGYGKKLMEKALTICKEPELRVGFANIKAVLLYLSLGFKFSGVYGKTYVMRYEKPIKRAKPTVQFMISQTNITLNNLSKIHTYFKDGYAIQKVNGQYKYVKVGHRISDIFQLNKLYTCTLKSKITAEFAEYMTLDTTLNEGLHAALKLPEFEEWYNEKGVPWLKRFESFMYKQYKYKISETYASRIGNRLREHAPRDYYMEIVNKPDWTDGQFNDGGSCWFGFRSYMMDDLFGSGRGYALKFYRSNKTENTNGLGRAWIYATDEHFFLFNSRGVRVDDIKTILCSQFNLIAKPVNLDVKSTPERYRYIDGITYYVFGRTEFPLPKYTMNWS